MIRQEAWLRRRVPNFWLGMHCHLGRAGVIRRKVVTCNVSDTGMRLMTRGPDSPNLVLVLVKHVPAVGSDEKLTA